jgi:hypothetical protein
MIDEATIRIPNNLKEVDSKIKEFYSKVGDFVKNNLTNSQESLDSETTNVKEKFLPKLAFWASELEKIKTAKKQSWPINPKFSIISFKPGDVEYYRASFRLQMPGQPNIPMVVHLGPAYEYPDGPETPELKKLARLKIIKFMMKKFPWYYKEMDMPSDPEELIKKSELVDERMKVREQIANEKFNEIKAAYDDKMGNLKNEKTSLKDDAKLFSVLKPKVSLILFDSGSKNGKYIRASFRAMNPETGVSTPMVVHVAPEYKYPDWKTNPEVQTLAEIKVLLFMLGKFPDVFAEFFEKSDFDF